jgi:hypothetical protein
MIKLEDLTVEFIKTAMLSQRIVLFPNGYGLSIMGGPFVCGDGIDTFDVSVIKHNFKTDKCIDYFGLDFSKYSDNELSFNQVCSNNNSPNVWFYVNKRELDSIINQVSNLS